MPPGHFCRAFMFSLLFSILGVDKEFEELLKNIFGKDFIETYKIKRPAGWVDLMVAFESRKRSASPLKSSPLNVSLPFSFIDYFKKHKVCSPYLLYQFEGVLCSIVCITS